MHSLPRGSLVSPAGPQERELSVETVHSQHGNFSAVGPMGSLAPDPISDLRGRGLGRQSWQTSGAPALAQQKEGRKVGSPPKGTSVTGTPAQGGEQASALGVTLHLCLEGGVAFLW